MSDFLLAPRWGAAVFAAGGRTYDWLDVFLAAMWRGEWATFERELHEGLARQAAGGDPPGVAVGEREVQNAADEFRYARGLISGDDALAWLERSGLTVDAWAGFLVRRLLRERWRAYIDQRPGHAAPQHPADDDVAAEGICSGAFDRFALVLAGRAATAVAGGGPIMTADPSRLDRVLREHRTWLAALDQRGLGERLSHVAYLDETFADRAGTVPTTDALASQLGRHRLAWTRVDLERLAFATADAAREAACCVRDDRRTLTEVAIDVRAPVRDTRDVLAQLEPALRDAVLSADIDTLIGPIEVGSRHELLWVLAKRPPDLADPLVRALAAAAVVEQITARAVLAHVRWTQPRGPIETTLGASIA
jgi:hypothetical protein